MKVPAGLFVLVFASSSVAMGQQTAPSPSAAPPSGTFAPDAAAAPKAPAAPQAPAQSSTPPPPGTPPASDQSSAPPAPNTLLDGTAVKLRTTENLSSGSNKTGQQVAFEVVEAVEVQGVTVIPKGGQALATITNAEPKKSMGRAGKLDVHIDSVRLADGEKAMLSATKAEKGGGHTGAMVGGMVATSIVFFPAAPFLLFIHGKDITIPKGTEVTAFVQGDMKLDLAKFAPVDASVPAATAISQPATTAVTVEASVPNCDIEVDGKFVGNSPSTVALTPGEHTVVVKKKGYADWSRTMQVSGPSAHLNAELEAKP